MKIILLTIVALNLAHATPLAEMLSQKKKTFTEKMPKEVVELHEKNIQTLKASGLAKKALNVGDKAPDVEVNVGGELHPLSHLYPSGAVVLKFYRGGWCPYCLTELAYYEKLHEDFKKAGARIIALAPDKKEAVAKTKKDRSLSFDITSDTGHAIARKFGLVYKLDSEIAKSLKKNGIDLAAFQGNDKNELAIPATYVIGKDGKIGFAFIDADYRVRAEPSVVLEAVKKINKN
jgi:peroxiredoxin